MARLYLASIRWVGTPMSEGNIKSMDLMIGNCGDWVRFNASTWIVWSEANSLAISNHIRSWLKPEDSVLVIALDASDMNGWAPKWVWDWINAKAQSRREAIPTGLLGAPPYKSQG